MFDQVQGFGLYKLLLEAHPASLLGRWRAHRDECSAMEGLRRLPPDLLRDIGIDPQGVEQADPRLVAAARSIAGRWL